MKSFLASHLKITKGRLLCLLAALASGLSISFLFDPFNEFGALWVALVPLLLVVRKKTPRAAFWTGWLTGIIAWTIQLHWLSYLAETGGYPPVVYIGASILILYLALYIGLFAYFAALLRKKLLSTDGTLSSSKRILLCTLLEPALWVALESIRSHLFTGFAWNPLGLAFTMNLPVFQLSAIGGVSLVSALIVALNGAITTLFERIAWSIRRQLPEQFQTRLLLSIETSLPFLLFLIAFLWGSHRIKTYDTLCSHPSDAINVLLQTTYNPTLATPGYKPINFFESALRDANFINILKGKTQFHLWITPESSFTHYDLVHVATPQHDSTRAARQALESIAASTAPLLLGGTYTPQQPTKAAYNASLLVTNAPFDPTQHLYRKRHLVPFGEYIPFDKTFPSLQSLVPTGVSCSAGDETTITLPSGHRFGPLICFDDCDAHLARESVNAGAQFLVNTSNDAWITSPDKTKKPSCGAVAHFRQAIARCVETGVPMLRTSNMGGATYIDAVGRVHFAHNKITTLKNYAVVQQQLTKICDNPNESLTIYCCTLPLTKTPFASSYLTAGETLVTLPSLLFFLGFLIWTILTHYQKKFKMKPTLSLLLLLGALPCIAQAAPINENDPHLYNLLPSALMAADDGNISIAEKTATQIITEVGLAPDRRAKAEEILIRTCLKRHQFDDAITRVNNCPELSADRRLVFLMLAHLGKQDYAKINTLYDEGNVNTSTDWGLAALRLALIADIQLGNNLRAIERFSFVNEKTTVKNEIHAANALAWAQTFPSPNAREALLATAAHAAAGGQFLNCALYLPTAFKNIPDTRPLKTVEQIIAQASLDAKTKAKLSYAAAQLSTNFEEKIAFAKAALETTDITDKYNAYFLLGEIYLSDKAQQELGLQYLKQAIVFDPSAKDAPYTQLRIAETYLEMGKNNLALKEYEAYRQSYATPELTPRYLQGHGRALLLNNNALDALEIFSRALDYVKDDNEKKKSLLIDATQAAVKANLYDRAIDFAKQRLEIDVQHRPEISLSIARLYEEKEDIKNATEYYTSICNMSSVANDIRMTATLRLGDIYLKNHRQLDAITRYTTTINALPASAPEREKVLLARATTYYAMANYERAKADFENLLHASSPEIKTEANFFLVLCLYRIGSDDEARLLAEDYISLSPDNHRVADVLLWLAKSDFNHGDYEKASKGFSTFITRWGKDPRLPHILYLEALSSYFNENYHQTLKSIARILSEFPNDPILPEARFLQAQALIQHARHAEARDILTEIIHHHPNAPWVGEAYGHLGDCLSFTAASDPMRLDAAILAYRNAIAHLEALDADKAICYRYKIGRAYERQSYRTDAAEEYYRLIYTILNQPINYTTNGMIWGKRALVRLNDIETAAGHTEVLNALHTRLLRADIPGLTPKNDDR